MNLIKFDAIASTNTYLKELQASLPIDNFTVVLAENQFDGRGQRGSNWSAEPNNNLTFSAFVKNFIPSPEFVFDLNIIVAVTIYSVLKNHFDLSFSIKWPNDIMAENKKIGGILIENILKADGAVQSVIGIGLNVNQKNFDSLPKASSLAVLLQKECDKQLLFEQLISELERNLSHYTTEQTNKAWDTFHAVLFKKDVVAAFESKEGTKFSGIIRNVSRVGYLQVELDNGKLADFALKDIQLLY